MQPRPITCVGFVGTTLDRGLRERSRWDRWRPTVSLFQHEDLLIERFVMLSDASSQELCGIVAGDIRVLSPKTRIELVPLDVRDPWDFEEVYGSLHGFARARGFDPEREDLLVHITTGTHVHQICCFLLTESRHLPGRLVQTSPPYGSDRGPHYKIIDLDLSRYDRLAARFRVESAEGSSFLKEGIQTAHPAFNQLIERIERVATRSAEPILLSGPTGAGKTRLARRIYKLKRDRRQVAGAFVEVNCATLRGDAAMSALFGHVRGAFTGAVHAREGLLRAADGGLLFLDEIGDLRLDEQAMLLRALEEKRFLPVGSDREVESDFQLISGSHADLRERVRRGRFREDLLARIDLWSFELPGLAERPEDIAPNLDYELEKIAATRGRRVHMSREARAAFLGFATSGQALWPGNFRELNAATRRMATLASSGRITETEVREEIARLRQRWDAAPQRADAVARTLGAARAAELDRFERVQLADVLEVCARSASLSEAGRLLFAVSRTKKTRTNDADRLRKYLARFGLSWRGLSLSRASPAEEV